MTAITKHDKLLGILAVLLVATALLLVREVLIKADSYLVVDSPYAGWLVPYRWFAVAMTAIALLVAGARRRSGIQAGGGLNVAQVLRGLAYAGLFAFAAGSVAFAWGGFEFSRLAIRSIFFSSLLTGVSVWLLVLMLGSPRRWRRWTWPLDVVALNLIFAFIAAELVLTFYARLSPTPLLWDEGSVVSLIEANRLPQSMRPFGFRPNSGGFHDEEFFAADDDDFVVALLSDSFGLGVVPYRYNFATIAEQQLRRDLAAPGRRVAVHNFGIASLDLTGYAWLLQHEVPDTNPTLVVLAVFVGNDIAGFTQRRNRYYALQYTRLFDLLRKLLAVGNAVRGSGWLIDGTPPQDPEPPHLHDPALEPPTMSRLKFLTIEAERFEKLHTRDAKIQRHYAAFFEALDFFHRQLGDRLMVMIIPDEYQVNDELFAEILGQVPDDPTNYVRDYPQQRIRDFCERRRIPVLDLLDRLREGQQTARVYHLHDTHWNARGNRIAGEAMAQFILEHRARADTPSIAQ